MGFLAKRLSVKSGVNINPYNDNYTVLYLPFENSLVDYSLGKTETHTPTNFGVTFSTVTKKIGDYSGYFNGSSYASFPDSDDWYHGAGDFTAHCWINRSSVGSAMMVFGQGSNAGANVTGIVLNSSNQLEWYDNSTIYTFTNSLVSSTGTWYHIAIVRSSGTLYGFVDGTKDAVSHSMSSTDIPYSMAIGRLGQYAVAYYNGYIDALYIDKGIARWTTNFTPPV